MASLSRRAEAASGSSAYGSRVCCAASSSSWSERGRARERAGGSEVEEVAREGGEQRGGRAEKERRSQRSRTPPPLRFKQQRGLPHLGRALSLRTELGPWSRGGVGLGGVDLAAADDDHRLERLARLRPHRLTAAQHVEPGRHGAKHDVLAVQVRGGLGAEEELRAGRAVGAAWGGAQGRGLSCAILKESEKGAGKVKGARLRAVGVGPRVGHRQDAGAGVLQPEIFVRKPRALFAGQAGPKAGREEGREGGAPWGGGKER